MENRPKGYGDYAEASTKASAKYDPVKEVETRAWMEEVVGEPICPDIDSDELLGHDRLHEALKDGTFLCKLAIAVTGNSIKYSNSQMELKMMENIAKFLVAAEDYGLKKTDLFQTMDLYEKTNMPQVVSAIYTFGRKFGK